MAPTPGLGIAFMVFNAVLIFGCLTIMVLMVIAFWRAMRAHQSIVGTNKGYVINKSLFTVTLTRMFAINLTKVCLRNFRSNLL